MRPIPDLQQLRPFLPPTHFKALSVDFSFYYIIISYELDSKLSDFIYSMHYNSQIYIIIPFYTEKIGFRAINNFPKGGESELL